MEHTKAAITCFAKKRTKSLGLMIVVYVKTTIWNPTTNSATTILSNDHRVVLLGCYAVSFAKH